MKKILFLIAVLLAGNLMVAQAQTEKGKWLLNGSSRLSFDSGKEKYKSGSTTSDSYKFTRLTFEPQVGYFVIDKLPVGLLIELSRESWKDPEDDDKSVYSSFIVGPFVRYYITDLDGLWPYAQAAVGIGSYKERWIPGEGDSQDDKSSLFGYRLGVGATYFVNDRVGFDVYLGYGNDTEKYTYEDEVSRDTDYKYIYGFVQFNLGIVVSLGQ
ncbi:hypothetical protein SDC9_23399 [bioreactor metagenome]|jgi:outer membrane protein|uniref:Opacity protein n=2 Tax=root TaxID=1 RepID=A0A0S7BZL7_9BACT|nr:MULTISPECIES: outer membrane beta-barrel protein [Lentimicrobium]MEA5111055.1 outer membrane beta-barrel protein [Lentimicrobium sp.]GAP43230.1 opacity protein [Lentimicrobium saccharophilum]